MIKIQRLLADLLVLSWGCSLLGHSGVKVAGNDMTVDFLLCLGSVQLQKRTSDHLLNKKQIKRSVPHANESEILPKDRRNLDRCACEAEHELALCVGQYILRNHEA